MDRFEIEWKKYCASKGGGAVTMNVKDVAKHFALWQKEQMMKDAEQIRFDCSLPCKTFDNLKAKGIEIGDKLLIIKE